MLTKISWSLRFSPTRFVRTALSSSSRVISTPLAVRRGWLKDVWPYLTPVPQPIMARVPSSETAMALPAALGRRSARNSFRRVAYLDHSPLPPISKMPHFIGAAKAIFLPSATDDRHESVFALQLKHDIDHVLQYFGAQQSTLPWSHVANEGRIGILCCLPVRNKSPRRSREPDSLCRRHLCYWRYRWPEPSQR